jgi:hypothetical protein
MAKKTKRKVSAVVTPAPAPEVAEVQVAERPSAASAGAASARAASAGVRSFGRRAPVAVEFNPDYTYILKDLKRIGALAGTFFVILIVLSFIIK